MILYVAESSTGGIAEYSVHQVNALTDCGLDVLVLCRPDYPASRLKKAEVHAMLPGRKPAEGRMYRIVRYIMDSRKVAAGILEIVRNRNPDYVLLDCYKEYFSPFWSPPLKKARKRGVRFGVVSHDPVRDFAHGPRWWHDFCIRTAYGMVDDVFIHADGAIDWGGPKPSKIRVRQIPHGPYAYDPPSDEVSNDGRRFGFSEDDFVVLSFGHIRDGKNLDKFIEAMPSLPERIKLLVAGSGGAKSQRPPEYYRKLAENLGVGKRCSWEIRYIGDQEIPGFFHAANLVLLIYSKDFVSASGVLNTAVRFKCPVLASGGDGPLKHALRDFRLGAWIDGPEPSLIDPAVRGLLDPETGYEFDAYMRAHSWERNAHIIKEAVGTTT